MKIIITKTKVKNIIFIICLLCLVVAFQFLLVTEQFRLQDGSSAEAPEAAPAAGQSKDNHNNQHIEAAATTTTATATATVTQSNNNNKYNNDSDDSSSCRRCKQYNNIIVVDKFCCAGLLDRLSIIARLAEIASYFCARVYVAPPWEMLSKTHNKGVPIPKTLTWSDFLNLTIQDYSDHVVNNNNKNDNNNNNDNVIIREYKDTWTPKGEKFSLHKLFVDEKNDTDNKDNNYYHKDNWLIVTSTDHGKRRDNERYKLETRHNLAILENFTQHQLLLQSSSSYYDSNDNDGHHHHDSSSGRVSGGFIWKVFSEAFKWNQYIQEYFLDQRQQRHDNNNTTTTTTSSSWCRLDNLQKNKALCDVIADDIFQSLLLSSSSSSSSVTAEHHYPTTTRTRTRTSTNHHHRHQFGILHIRRTDAIAQCDTSIEKITRYLSCGSSTDNSAGNSDGGILEGVEAFVDNTTILFASDETEPCYRSAILDILRQHFGFHHVVDLDTTVRDYLKNRYHNNFSIVVNDNNNEDPSGQSGNEKYLNNNMFEFAIINSMYWDPRMKFHLIQRRQSHCDDCSYFRDRLSGILQEDDKVAGNVTVGRGGGGAVIPSSVLMDGIIASIHWTYDQCLSLK